MEIDGFKPQSIANIKGQLAAVSGTVDKLRTGGLQETRSHVACPCSLLQLCKFQSP